MVGKFIFHTFINFGFNTFLHLNSTFYKVFKGFFRVKKVENNNVTIYWLKNSALIKIHEAQAEYIFFYLLVFSFLCLSWPLPLGQKKNDIDLKFSNSSRAYLKVLFCFFEKFVVRVICLKKLRCHMDLPHIINCVLDCLLSFLVIQAKHIFKHLHFLTFSFMS